jgi:dephospho-CoA kinase
MKLVGLTGGIGSGKTTVARVFETLGVPVFKADDATREAMNDPGILERVVALLGKGIFNDNGNIERGKIAAIVFADPAKLEKLNAILHPAAREMFKSWLKMQNAAYVIKEAAILFESGAWKDMDLIISVSASEAVRIERVIKRDGLQEEDVRKRIANQIEENERIRRSDFVVFNEGQHSVIEQVMEIHKKLSDPELN